MGGIGERRIQRLFCFRQEGGVWSKVYETEDLDMLDKYELPYHAAGLSIIMPDGSERMVSGVVDEEFIRKYNEAV